MPKGLDESIIQQPFLVINLQDNIQPDRASGRSLIDNRLKLPNENEKFYFNWVKSNQLRYPCRIYKAVITTLFKNNGTNGKFFVSDRTAHAY